MSDFADLLIIGAGPAGMAAALAAAPRLASFDTASTPPRISVPPL